MERNGPQTMDQMDGNLQASDNIGDCKFVNNDLKKYLLETDSAVQSLKECPKVAAGSTENQFGVSTGSKKKNIRKKIKKAKMQDEIKNMYQAKMDTGSTENLAKENVNGKRKRRGKKKKAKGKDDIQRMDQVDGMLNLHLSDGNHGEGIDGKLTEKDCAAQESGISARKESSLSDLEHNMENPLALCKYEEAEVSVRKETSVSDLVHGKENPLDLCKDEATVLLPDVVEVARNGVSSEIVEERFEYVLRPMEVDSKFIPCESQLSPHPNQMASENVKREDWSNKVDVEIVVEEECSAESRSIFSTCDVGVSPLTTSGGEDAEWLSKDLGQYPRIESTPSIKRKLIVLDVNGLLANIVMPAPKDCRGDVHILGRAIFKRPFCDDFLRFCFENFDVGVWSSRTKKIIDRVVDYLLGDMKDKLLFCWDMSHSTQTGFNTLENIHKPLVFKELRKIWENDDPNLPWKKGDYNESNTLLLDDSPYKALLNPWHTAVFPNSYHYEDKNDNSLGPGGDLRVYLEGLLTTENVQNYVEQHPFGQSAINENNLSWGFYSGVLQTMSNRLQNNSPSSLPTFDTSSLPAIS